MTDKYYYIIIKKDCEDICYFSHNNKIECYSDSTFKLYNHRKEALNDIKKYKLKNVKIERLNK